MKKAIIESCKKCQERVLSELGMQFKEYRNLLIYEMTDEIPMKIFKYEK